VAILAEMAPPDNGTRASGIKPDLCGPPVSKKLPSYGGAYLNHLIGEFNSLKDVCANKDSMRAAQEIVNKAQAGCPMSWGDVYMLDTAIAQMLPKEYLHQRAWCLEVKYRDAVGNADAYDAFMKAESPHLINESEEHLRARVHNLIRELYRLYTVIDCREAMRESLLRRAGLTLVVVVGLTLIVLATDKWSQLNFLDVWCLIFAAGATGAVLSLQRRMQSLPSNGESLSDLVELSDRMSVRLTPIIGGIFALILSLIFASGLATGELFPKLESQSDIKNLTDFLRQLQPHGVVEWGKLLVWSFIAGFAERLVPDTLDRLIAKSEQTKRAA